MNKKHTTAISVLIVAVIILLLGVLNTEFNIGTSREDYFTFTDSRGELVILEEKPEKVAALSPMLAELWQSAGGEVSITVEEAVELGLCKEDTILADNGGDAVDIDLLISQEPDLVLCCADDSTHSQAAATLRKAGIPVAELEIESFEDYLKILKVLSSVAGNPTSYQTDEEIAEAELKYEKLKRE